MQICLFLCQLICIDMRIYLQDYNNVVYWRLNHPNEQTQWKFTVCLCHFSKLPSLDST